MVAPFTHDGRAEQAAIAELLLHGGTAEDLRRLRQFFKKSAESEHRDAEIPE